MSAVTHPHAFDSQAGRASGGLARRRIAEVALLLMLFAGWAGPALVAQDPNGAGAEAAPGSQALQDADVSAELIDRRIDEIEGDESLDADLKARLLDEYRAAAAELNRVTAAGTRAAEARTRTAEAPGAQAALDAALQQPPPDGPPDVPAGASLEELEALQDAAEEAERAAGALVGELTERPATRTARRSTLAEEKAAATKRLEAITAEREAAPAPEESATWIEARATRLAAEERALRAMLDAGQAEVEALDATNHLVALQLDAAERELALAQGRLTFWGELVSNRRTAAAQEADRLKQRELDAIRARHPALEAVAAENAALSAMRLGPEGLTEATNQSVAYAQKTRQLLADVRNRAGIVLRRTQRSGLTETMGQLLRKHGEKLPSISTLKREQRRQLRALATSQSRLVELETRREELGAPDVQLAEIMAGAEANGPIDNSEALQQVAQQLLTQRRDEVQQLKDDYEAFEQSLWDIQPAETELLALTGATRTFIESRVLWVPSIRAEDGIPSIEDTLEAGQWLFKPSAWAEAAANVAQVAKRRPAVITSVMLPLLLLLLIQPWCRRALAHGRGLVRDRQTDAYAHTVRGMVMIVITAAPLSATLWTIGWALTLPLAQNETALAVGFGLQATAAYLYPLRLLGRLVAKDGFGEVHFRWAAQATELTRRQLRWFMPLSTPMVFFVETLGRHPHEEYMITLGRCAFIVGSVALGLFMKRLLNLDGALTKSYLSAHRRGMLIDRLRVAWYAFCFLFPFAMALLAALRFLFTAHELQLLFLETLVLVLALVLTNAMTTRWQFLVRRKLLVEQGRKRREQARAAAEQAAALAGAAGASAEEVAAMLDPGDDPAVTMDEEPDVLQMNAQARTLLRTTIGVLFVIGMYSTWSETLPALQMLERIRLYPDPGIIASEQLRDATMQELNALLEAHSAAPPPPATDVAVAATPDAKPGASLPLGALTPSTDSQERTEAQPLEVSLADLGLALVILVGSIVAARNLPALLEMILLQRLPLDSGARYAIKTVTSYTITILGITMAFGALGIGWSNVQWLAAALTFGLGFGLQEIFANFVSGLIILVERPVRLGDLVTVGTVEGRVTRIRIRATTITDWDRRELLVPNREFITGQVTNWTLTDPITRVVIPVGVAYGSNTIKARETLLRIAQESEFVMDDPAPSAIFNGFGDSTLNLSLRVFLPTRDVWAALMNQLHTRIDEEFAKDGIEIAFPQLDVHVRDTPTSAATESATTT